MLFSALSGMFRNHSASPVAHRRVATTVTLVLLVLAGQAHATGFDAFVSPRVEPETALPEHAALGAVVRARFDARALLADRISIPRADGPVVQARRISTFRDARGAVTWRGALADAPGSLVVITQYRGLTTGFLHVEDHVYEIDTASDGRARIYRIDDQRIPEEAAPLTADTGSDLSASASAMDAALATAPEATHVQDVLIVYTPRAAAAAGSATALEGSIINAVAAANAAYVDSGVDATLSLVGLTSTPYVETGDFYTSLARLSGTSDGYMDEVHGLRNTLRADLVVLVSEDTTYCGLAYLMGSPSVGFAGSAFAVVKPACFSNQTLAHEIGHLQGNDHDRLNGTGGAFPYSFGYRTCDAVAPTNGQSFRTVMSYSCAGSPRLNYFSNPAILYNGAPMGVSYEQDPARSADNARSMNATAPYVSAFRSTTTVTSPPTEPAPAAVAPGLAGAVVTWADVATETTFEIRRETLNTRKGSWSAAAITVAGNTTRFEEALASGTYRYRVRALNTAGVSSWVTAGCSSCGTDGSFSLITDAGRKRR